MLTESEVYALDSAQQQSKCLRAGWKLCHKKIQKYFDESWVPRWDPKPLPTTFARGETFSVDHALHSLNGGDKLTRHNGLGEMFAELMRDVWFAVEAEAKLQPLQCESFEHKTTKTEDDARLDIKTNSPK